MHAGLPSDRIPQCEIKCRPLTDLALGPDLPAMLLDHPLHDREPDAAARELVFGVQAVERLEEFILVRHIDI